MGNRENSSGKNRFFLILGLLIIFGLISLYFLFAEQQPPQVSFAPEKEFITPDTKFDFRSRDKESGLDFFSIHLVQGDKEIEMLKKDFDKKVEETREELGLQEYRLKDGSLDIKIKVRDNSWSNWFKGNAVVKTFNYTLDTEPPRITLKSYKHNLEVGGSGLVAFNVNEPVKKVGVQANGYFFPAYRSPESDMYLCFFSYPYEFVGRDANLLIKAVDKAGNVRKTGFNYFVSRRNFRESNIRISSEFLHKKMPGFQDNFPATSDKLELFLKVNKELRAKNRKKLLSVGGKTVKNPLWSGSFLRLPNSAKRSSFGTYRTYLHQGQKIDSQRHLGVDLASVKGAKIPAANSGKVAYTGWLGILGQVVIIDHGLGLQSMYAHLSRIKVQEQDKVDKGEIIGNTGSTGLAGGDHLHFAILVSGVPVSPVQWWDKAWIENNIKPTLNLLENNKK